MQVFDGGGCHTPHTPNIYAPASNTLPLRPASPQIFLSKKKRIRGGYRAHATKLCSEAKSLIDSEEPLVSRIEYLTLSLKEKLTLMSKVDDEIFNLTDDDEIEGEVFECEELKSEIQYLIIDLNTKLKKVNAAGENEVNSVGTASSNNVIRNIMPIQDDSPKLPALHLPKLNGDPHKWQEWWDYYEVVHCSSITPITKFRHLKTLLEGPAAAALTGIQITSANYTEAIDILKQRFAQKQVIVNAHMESLLNLQAVSRERDIKALRKLYDNIESNVRSLKTLGVNFEQYGTLLIPIIMSKLPEETRLVITKEIKGRIGVLMQL